MSILLFIIILAVLIVVHEFGHFLAARSVGARVDEFGLGFPPRVWAFRPTGSETTYSLNWIPFGGFVKILGENGDEEIPPEELNRSLTSKNRLAQVWVLAAGIIFNILFAWLLLTISFAAGVTTSVTPETEGLADIPRVMVLETFDGAPAAASGLMPGDAIVEISTQDGQLLVPAPEISARPAVLSVADIQEAVHESAGIPLLITYEREGVTDTVTVTPSINEKQEGIIGVSLDLVGTVKLSFGAALIEAAHTVGRLLDAIARGLGSFFAGALTGTADYSTVSGPVGIVGLVRDVSSHGFIALLSFTAIISLNLAVINLVPFPALDGGRILFVAVEALIRRRLPAVFTQWANVIGFGILILLMIVITVSDVLKLF